jgi:hypothetical protein
MDWMAFCARVAKILLLATHANRLHGLIFSGRRPRNLWFKSTIDGVILTNLYLRTLAKWLFFLYKQFALLILSAFKF